MLTTQNAVVPVPDRVRAKFKVDTVQDVDGGFKTYLHPVTEGSSENEQFFKWTPAGELSLEVVNPSLREFFEPGKEYYVDITPA